MARNASNVVDGTTSDQAWQMPDSPRSLRTPNRERCNPGCGGPWIRCQRGQLGHTGQSAPPFGSLAGHRSGEGIRLGESRSGCVLARPSALGSRSPSKPSSAARLRSAIKCPAPGLAPVRQRCTLRTFTWSDRANSRQLRSAASQKSARRSGKSGGNRECSVRYKCCWRRPTCSTPPAPDGTQVFGQQCVQSLRYLRRQAD